MAPIVAVLLPAVLVQRASGVVLFELTVAGKLSILPGWLYLQLIENKGQSLYDEYVPCSDEIEERAPAIFADNALHKESESDRRRCDEPPIHNPLGTRGDTCLQQRRRRGSSNAQRQKSGEEGSHSVQMSEFMKELSRSSELSGHKLLAAVR